MNTSSFLASLRAHPGLPLVFRAGGRIIPAGYHLTEVKRVTYQTMDCGALRHDWSENQFELWAPAPAGALPARGHMPADKFLRIVDRVEGELPLAGDALARIHTSFDGQPAALYDVTAITPGADGLWIELAPDRTRCKAAERRGADAAGAACGCTDRKSPAACCA